MQIFFKRLFAFWPVSRLPQKGSDLPQNDAVSSFLKKYFPNQRGPNPDLTHHFGEIMGNCSKTELREILAVLPRMTQSEEVNDILDDIFRLTGTIPSEKRSPRETRCVVIPKPTCKIAPPSSSARSSNTSVSQDDETPPNLVTRRNPNFRSLWTKTLKRPMKISRNSSLKNFKVQLKPCQSFGSYLNDSGLSRWSPERENELERRFDAIFESCRSRCKNALKKTLELGQEGNDWEVSPLKNSLQAIRTLNKRSWRTCTNYLEKLPPDNLGKAEGRTFCDFQNQRRKPTEEWPLYPFKSPAQCGWSMSHSHMETTCQGIANRDWGSKFEKQFRTFSKFGLRRSTGVVITQKRSNQWLRQAKLMDRFFTAQESSFFFKKLAGLGLVLSKQSYLVFLDNLARYKNLNKDMFVGCLTTCGTPQKMSAGDHY